MRWWWHYYVEFNLELDFEKKDDSKVHYHWTLRFRPVVVVLVLVFGALAVASTR